MATVAIFLPLGALTALLRFRVDVAWIIPSAGLAGLLLYLVGNPGYLPGNG